MGKMRIGAPGDMFKAVAMVIVNARLSRVFAHA